MKKINLGIIGVGRIGKLHCDNLIQNQNVSIKAVTDPLIDKDWAISRNLTIVDSVDLIFNDKGIDAVFIMSPSTLHAEQIILAAQAGKHIFCEKPIALDPLLIQKALDIVEKAGVKLQVGFNRRFDPNFMYLRDNYKAGNIGDLYMVKIIARDPAPPPVEYVKSSGGIFLDMTIHDFDMVRYLSGSEVTEVFAAGAVLIDPEIGRAGDIDTAITTLTLENGALAVIDNSREAVYGYDQRIELFGSKGSIRAENNTATRSVMMREEGTLSERPLDFFLERYQESFRLEVNEFFNAIIEDKSITADGKAGLVSILIGLAAKKSLALNRPVRIDEIRHEYFGK
jgi:myo-inositol 2-dehydrogenase/D-chiro-inositol 1-dehydrogenase